MNRRPALWPFPIAVILFAVIVLAAFLLAAPGLFFAAWVPACWFFPAPVALLPLGSGPRRHRGGLPVSADRVSQLVLELTVPDHTTTTGWEPTPDSVAALIAQGVLR